MPEAEGAEEVVEEGSSESEIRLSGLKEEQPGLYNHHSFVRCGEQTLRLVHLKPPSEQHNPKV